MKIPLRLELSDDVRGEFHALRADLGKARKVQTVCAVLVAVVLVAWLVDVVLQPKRVRA